MTDSCPPRVADPLPPPRTPPDCRCLRVSSPPRLDTRKNFIIEVLDTVITCFFGVDILVQFSTALQDTRGRSGAVTADRAIIARKYIRSWFLVDVASTIPFDTILSVAIGGGGNTSRLRLLGFLKARWSEEGAAAPVAQGLDSPECRRGTCFRAALGPAPSRRRRASSACPRCSAPWTR